MTKTKTSVAVSRWIYPKIVPRTRAKISETKSVANILRSNSVCNVPVINFNKLAQYRIGSDSLYEGTLGSDIVSWSHPLQASQRQVLLDRRKSKHNDPIRP